MSSSWLVVIGASHAEVVLAIGVVVELCEL